MSDSRTFHLIPQSPWNLQDCEQPTRMQVLQLYHQFLSSALNKKATPFEAHATATLETLSALHDHGDKWWTRARDSKHIKKSLETLLASYKSTVSTALRRSIFQQKKEEKFLKSTEEIFPIIHFEAPIVTYETRLTEAQKQARTLVETLRNELPTNSRANESDKKVPLMATISERPAKRRANEFLKGLIEVEKGETEDTKPPKVPRESGRFAHKQKVPPVALRQMDRRGESDKQAAASLNLNVATIVPEFDLISVASSATSIHRARVEEREKLRQESLEFTPNGFVQVFFDGKTYHGEDRLAILVTDMEGNTLLEIPTTGKSGEGVGDTVATALMKRGISPDILTFDTTAVNTGPKGGANIVIERRFGRPCLRFPCRHHTLELIVKSIHLHLLPTSKSPEWAAFVKLRQHWKLLNLDDYDAINHPSLEHGPLAKMAKKAKEFLIKSFNDGNYRDDYLESIALALLCLGVPVYPYVQKKRQEEHYKIKDELGCIIESRWMCNIVILKMALFRRQLAALDLDEETKQGFCDPDTQEKIIVFAIFISVVYLSFWLVAPNTVDAPLNELNLYKATEIFETVFPEVGAVARKKQMAHLEFLGEENCGMGIFSSNVPDATRSAMAKKLVSIEKKNQISDFYGEFDGTETKRSLRYVPSEGESFLKYDLQHFIGPRSFFFFAALRIPTGFLHQPLRDWAKNEDYKRGLEIVEKLEAVNDCAERGCKVLVDFRDRSKSEKNLQGYLQAVWKSRAELPKSTKKAVLSLV